MEKNHRFDTYVEKDLTILYEGIENIPRYSYTSGVCPFGIQAFPIVNNGEFMPIIAGARYGRGRIIAAGNGDYFNPKDVPEDNTNKLIYNMLVWLTRDESENNKDGNKFKVITKDTLFKVNSSMPIDVINIDTWTQEALRVDNHIVLYVGKDIDEEEMEILDSYIRSGGSIIVAEKGWELVEEPDKEMQQLAGDNMVSLGYYPLQKLLNKVGLSLLNNVALWDNDPNNPISKISVKNAIDAHGNSVIEKLKRIESGDSHIEDISFTKDNIDDNEKIKLLSEYMNHTINSLSSDCYFLDYIKEDAKTIMVDELYNAQDKPYSKILQSYKFSSVTLDENNKKSKLADDFPGTVPEDAERVVGEVVEVNFDYENLDYLRMYSTPDTWQSTGLYAPPGETIDIFLPDGVADIYVQIGAHIDDNSCLSEWKRAPVVAFKKKLVEGINRVNSPYGGLIYFIPTRPIPNTKVDIKVSGAVKAPYFILGVHSDEEWKTTIRNNSAPWSELQSEHVILTISSKEIRNLDNPNELMEEWDRICEAFNRLVGLDSNNPIPHKNPDRPFRYVSDKQIIAGWLHAGYPIMLHEGITSESMIDIDGIQNVKSGWGFWHELGHNYQQRDWVWDAIVEVTCNIFSLYIQDKYNDESRLFSENAYENAFKFIKENNENKDYNDDRQIGYFERLVMFRQLQLAYGWELYTKLHIEYRELSEEDFPQNEQEKVDLFVLKTCEIAGENLMEFYDKWGLNYGEDTKKKIDEMKLPLPKVKLWELVE